MNTFHTTTPRTDAALALVAKARETESDYKCHDALIMSHVSLEIDYNDLRAEVKRLREALAQALRYVEVQHAYRGAMTAAEVEAAIIANASIAEVRIGANSCNTLAAFDLFKARAALGAAE